MHARRHTERVATAKPPSSLRPPQEFKSSMMGAYESCGFMGERVIGFAYK